MSFEGFYSLTVAVYSLIYSLIRGIYSLTTTIYSLIYLLGLYLSKSFPATFCGLLVIVVLSPNRIRNTLKYAISPLNPKSTHPNYRYNYHFNSQLPTIQLQSTN